MGGRSINDLDETGCQLLALNVLVVVIIARDVQPQRAIEQVRFQAYFIGIKGFRFIRRQTRHTGVEATAFKAAVDRNITQYVTGELTIQRNAECELVKSRTIVG